MKKFLHKVTLVPLFILVRSLSLFHLVEGPLLLPVSRSPPQRTVLPVTYSDLVRRTRHYFLTLHSTSDSSVLGLTLHGIFDTILQLRFSYPSGTFYISFPYGLTNSSSFSLVNFRQLPLSLLSTITGPDSGTLICLLCLLSFVSVGTCIKTKSSILSNSTMYKYLRPRDDDQVSGMKLILVQRFTVVRSDLD